jgi:competence protein ComEC
MAATQRACIRVKVVWTRRAVRGGRDEFSCPFAHDYHTNHDRHNAPGIMGPLLGGYLLVALVAEWCGGIVLRQAGPLAGVGVLAWVGVALAGAGIALVAAVAGRLTSSRMTGIWATIWRAALLAGLLTCGAALGAARATQADPANDPASLARFVSAGAPAQVRLRGSVALEPDVRGGYRLLTLDASAVSQDGGRTWETATGRVEVAWYGPDDWFAPAYGDTLELTGTLAPPGPGAASGVVAWLNKAHGSIDARGGGNPIFAWLFQSRVALAQAIQHALPEPEASLLIGILLGLKTVALRARLPLFTATGTIHLVVPAGLKVSVLATLAADALRLLGRWPRVAGSIGAVALYAALGGSGPPAVRAAIMGSLLVLAGALGRNYNVFTALAVAKSHIKSALGSYIRLLGFRGRATSSGAPTLCY